MLCQECHKRPATCCIKGTINNQKVEIYLCEECKVDYQKNTPISAFLPGLNINLGELFSLINEVWREAISPKQKSSLDDTCPQCGLSFRVIQEKMKFGCGNCYRFFRRKVITQIIASCQDGAIMHFGKRPHQGKAKIESPRVSLLDLKKEKEKLVKELGIAVATENFEEASRIRDRIKELEKELAKTEVKTTG